MLFEQIVGYSRYQRRKMRMERIEPHLRFCNLNCSSGLPDRVKDLCKSVIDKIGVQRSRAATAGRLAMSIPCCAAVAIRDSASAPSRIRTKAHNSAERVPLRQCATTGAGASRNTAANASTSARDKVAAVTGM